VASAWRRGAAYAFDILQRRWAAARSLGLAGNCGLSAWASCEGVGSAGLYDVASATERVVATGLRTIDTIEWEPNGDAIAFLYPPAGCGAPGALGVVDVASGPLSATPLRDGLWRLDRKALLPFLFTQYIYPGIRMRYDGTPVVLGPPREDEPWVPGAVAAPLPDEADLGAA